MPRANVDDGSCSFPEQYYNCEGSATRQRWRRVCEELEVEGCQDETACNFDGLATIRGVLTQTQDSIARGTSLCTEDLNDNNAVEVGDVLLVWRISDAPNCAADITGDGFVTVDDVLVLLSAFGSERQ